jgi:hypothetical protein
MKTPNVPKLKMPGYCAADVGENEEMRKLRERELSDGGGADFSNVPLRLRPDVPIATDRAGKLADVPIAKLVRIGTTNNLDNYEERMTFGEILFQCLHGASWTKESIDYMCGDAVKSEGYAGYKKFPQIPGISKCNSKYLARGGMTFSLIHGVYYCDQGQQRAIMARYAIFQRFGIEGVLKNVYVYDATPDYVENNKSLNSEY